MKKYIAIISLLIVLTIIFSGYYCFKNGQINNKNRIAIFIDEYNYNQLCDEINQYIKNIRLELNVEIDLYHEEYMLNLKPDPQSEEIRNLLKNSYESNNLVGAIFIGDAPMAWYYNEPNISGFEDGYYVNDYYYMDLDSKYEDADNDGFIEFSANYSIKSELKPEIWVGRIKPPVNGSEGVELLKDYFIRNNEFRNGEIKSPKKILWFHCLALEKANELDTYKFLKEWYYNGMENSVFLSQAWDVDTEVDIIFNNEKNATLRIKNATDEYLNNLKNNKYEFFAYEGHGNITEHDYNVTFSTIKKIKPQISFGILASCRLGAFSTQNYLAGWYLFSGSGLVILAESCRTWGSIPEIQQLYKFVNSSGLLSGKTFGEAFKDFMDDEPYKSTVLLGDPTLKFRYG